MNLSDARSPGSPAATPATLAMSVAAARRRLLEGLDAETEATALRLPASAFARFAAALDAVEAAARAADVGGPEDAA
jgi:hypothetical protein